jgi:hypothetical protein
MTRTCVCAVNRCKKVILTVLVLYCCGDWQYFVHLVLHCCGDWQYIYTSRERADYFIR